VDNPIVTEEFMIPGPDAGTELYVGNKRPQSLSTFTRHTSGS